MRIGQSLRLYVKLLRPDPHTLTQVAKLSAAGELARMWTERVTAYEAALPGP